MPSHFNQKAWLEKAEALVKRLNTVKLHQAGSIDHTFFCPGCECAHVIRTSGEKAWQWNGSLTTPTFSPSYLVLGERRCHSFIKEGRIQFLDDCWHELKGQTVDLPEWPTRPTPEER